MNRIILSCGILFISLSGLVFADGVVQITNHQEQVKVECSLGSVAEASRRFSYALYKVASMKHNNKNIFLAPSTVGMGLAMILPGAAGKTKLQISTALQMNFTGNYREEDIGCLLGTYDNSLIKESLQNKKSDDFDVSVPSPVVLQTAAKIYAEESFSFNKSYIQITKNYGAEMQLVDFTNHSEESRNEINSWVAEKTENKIPELFNPSTIGANTKLAVVSAIYFKAAWKMPFKEHNTFQYNFTVNNETIIKANYMSHQDNYRFTYSKEMEADIVEVPYKDDPSGRYNVSMILIVPTETMDMVESGLEENILGGENGILQKLFTTEPTTLRLILPKFEIEANYQLKPLLKELGIKNLFRAGKADLSGMVDSGTNLTATPLHVSAAVHKTYIKIDERGTEAAGASGYQIIGLSLPPRVFVNRPFITMIYEKKTNGILFIGKILQPTNVNKN